MLIKTAIPPSLIVRMRATDYRVGLQSAAVAAAVAAVVASAAPHSHRSDSAVLLRPRARGADGMPLRLLLLCGRAIG